MKKQVKWYGSEKMLRKNAAKFTVIQLAKKYGVHEKTVYSTCKKLDVPLKSTYEGTNDAINKALAKDPSLTAKGLSKLLGISVVSIFQRNSRGDIKPKLERKLVPLDQGEVEELAKTMGIQRMSWQLGVGFKRLSKYMKDRGIEANQSKVKLCARNRTKPEAKPENQKKQVAIKQQSAKKQVLQPVAKTIIWPEEVKIQVIKPNTCNDWRNAMARPTLSSFKETSWRY